MSQELQMNDAPSKSANFAPRIPVASVSWTPTTAMFFWGDGTQSELDFNERRFLVGQFGFDANGFRQNQPNYLKRMIARTRSPAGTPYAFWHDGTYCELGDSPENFEYLSNRDSWPDWPVGRTLIAACLRSDDSDAYTYFFWNDGSYGKYSWGAKRFISTHEPQSTLAEGWPVSKKLIGAVNDLSRKEVYLFWGDGTYNAWGLNALSENTPMTHLSGWPCEQWEIFTPTLHEIDDIRINYNLGHQTICINDNDPAQTTVNVWLKVRNKASGEYTKIRDSDTNGNALIMFYDYQLGPEENRRSYLDLDGVGGRSFSKEWRISRSPRSDKEVVSASDSAAASSDDGIITHAVSNAPASVAESDSYFDGWNRFTYYVMTTEPTAIKQLAARVGGAGTYQYTGSNGWDEYASITVKKFSHPLTLDYQNI